MGLDVIIEDLNAISETTVMLRYPDVLIKESYIMLAGSIQDQVELPVDKLCCEGPHGPSALQAVQLPQRQAARGLRQVSTTRPSRSGKGRAQRRLTLAASRRQGFAQPQFPLHSGNGSQEQETPVVSHLCLHHKGL